MQRIVVGVDRSAAAAGALVWATRLARGMDAEVVAVSAFEPAEGHLPPARDEVLRADAAAGLAGWLAQVPGLETSVRPDSVEGPADRVLLDRAEDEGAALLVVGTRGAGGFAGLRLGSVAYHLSHRATVPLAIVPVEGADRPLGTAVVGVDGSAGSDAALAWIAGTAPGTVRRVVALHAAEPFAEWVPESDRSGWRRHLAREVDVWVKPLRDAGLDVRIVIDRDIHPVAAIERAANANGAGLVVVGKRGIGGFGRLHLGRVPLQLVHHLGVPVVMVPPG